MRRDAKSEKRAAVALTRNIQELDAKLRLQPVVGVAVNEDPACLLGPRSDAWRTLATDPSRPLRMRIAASTQATPEVR